MPIPPTSRGQGREALARFLWRYVLWPYDVSLEGPRENGPLWRGKRGRPRGGARATRSLTIVLKAL